MPGGDARFDLAAPDLAALHANPSYMYVPDAANRDAGSLCDQAEHVLKILDGARGASRYGTVRTGVSVWTLRGGQRAPNVKRGRSH